MTLGSELDPELKLPLPTLIGLLCRLDIRSLFFFIFVTCRYRHCLLLLAPVGQLEWETRDEPTYGVAREMT